MALKIGIGTGIPYQQGVVGAAAPPPWTPASLPDLELWLANSSLEAIGDAQPCAQWDDESGNARHAIQASGPSQPTVRLNADGLYEVDFDAVDDFLSVPDWPSTAQPITWWAVCKADAASLCLFDGTTTGFRHQLFFNSTPAWRMFAGSTFTVSVSSDLNLHAIVGIFNGASSVVRQDGVQLGAAGNVGAEVQGALRIGITSAGSFFWNGAIRDFGACSSVLAGDDLTNLETYLAGLVP